MRKPKSVSAIILTPQGRDNNPFNNQMFDLGTRKLLLIKPWIHNQALTMQ